MTKAIPIVVCHIRTSAGARFSIHKDLEELRQELIEYTNEVLAESCLGYEVSRDATLEQVIEAIEEVEDVSYEETEIIPFENAA